jgi:hypothetical protein
MYLVWYWYGRIQNIQTGCGQPSLLFNVHHHSFLGVKWAVCEVNHSPPSSARDQNVWSYISASPTHLHDVDREKFTFTVYSTVRISLLHATMCSYCYMSGRKNMLCWIKEHDEV